MLVIGDISFIDLTRIFSMLMTLSTGIKSNKISDIQVLDKKFYKPITSVIKQITHLVEYLKRTQAFQKTNNLFLTCIKPYITAISKTVAYITSYSKYSILYIVYFSHAKNCALFQKKHSIADLRPDHKNVSGG